MNAIIETNDSGLLESVENGRCFSFDYMVAFE